MTEPTRNPKGAGRPKGARTKRQPIKAKAPGPAAYKQLEAAPITLGGPEWSRVRS